MTDLCNTSNTLRIFLILKILFQIICIIIPIILMYNTIVPLAKNAIANEPNITKEVPNILKRVIAALLVLIMPSAIQGILSTTTNYDSSNLLSCYNRATTEQIKILEEQEEQELEDQKESEKESIIEAEALNKAEEVIKIDGSENPRGTLGQTGANGGVYSDTSTDATGEVLSSGTSSTYFAPLQGASYSLGSINSTAGCNGGNQSAAHDASVSTGTKVYAAMDGTITYYQVTCSNLLYSYGNMAYLTGSDGTYIIYAHLSGFAGATAQVTETCPKKSNGGAPCPASSCTSGIKKINVGTRTVSQGELIGYTGDTGNSTGPHLHVEIHENGSSMCVTDPWSAFGMR